jgi:long-chain acyl-CoA synthetase
VTATLTKARPGNDSLSMGGMLLSAASDGPNRPAIVSDRGIITYRDLADDTLRLADSLRREFGADPGDRVAALLDSHEQYVNLWHATAMGSGALVPLNVRLSAREIAFTLADCDPSVIVVDAANATTLTEALRLLPGPHPPVVTRGEVADLPAAGTVGDLIAAGEPRDPARVDGSELALLVYTGGTTGRSKGCAHDRERLAACCLLMSRVMALDESTSWMAALPMFHVGALAQALFAFANGSSIRLLDRFDPAVCLRAISEDALTHISGVPTTHGMLLSHPDFTPERLASVRTIVYGGEPMPTALRLRMQDVMPEAEFVTIYGQTETLANVTWLGDEGHRAGGERSSSVGRPFPGVQVEIRDPESGAVVPVGEPGEICIKSPTMMRGYWRNPEADEAAFDGSGWYRSGDAGRFDAEHNLYVVDRVKDMIISGGENVYCLEVENVLREHEGVAAAAVVGVPDERWGEVVHAEVILVPGAELGEAELVAFVRQRLAGYKTPKSVGFRTDPFPVSPVGKVLKRALRDDVLADRADDNAQSGISV